MSTKGKKMRLIFALANFAVGGWALFLAYNDPPTLGRWLCAFVGLLMVAMGALNWKLALDK